MKRSLLFTGMLVLSAASALTGWHLATGAARETVPSVKRPPASTLPGPAPVTGDYAGVIQGSWQARDGRPLADILEMVKAQRFSPALETQGELLALLGELEPGEIPEVLDFLRSLPPPVPSCLFEAVLGRWAESDGPAAMAWAESLPLKQREDVRGGILAAWVRQDSKAAWQWYLNAWAAEPEPKYRLEEKFPAFIHAWAMKDLQGALEACLSEEKHGTYDSWAGLGSLAALPEYRERLLETITTGIKDEQKRQSALRSTLYCWARKDPASAAAWLDQYTPSKADNNLVWAIAESYGTLDPRANTEWLWSRTPPEKRDEILGYGLSSWSRSNPAEAGAWLEQAGVTDGGAQIMASAWARRDLDRAVAWAGRVSPEKRADAVASAIAGSLSMSLPPGPGNTPDVTPYAAIAGVSAEDLAKRVEKTRQIWGSRL